MRYLPLLALALTLGCNSKDRSGLEDTALSWPDNTEAAVLNYTAIVEATYADSLAAAETLNAALEALASAPSQAALDDARTSWLDSREPYLQTEVFRFYDGPIDNPDDGPEGLINAWPMDEHYVDYTIDDPATGIVNSDEPIDAGSLEELNESGGEANIATGYHAIEFLLWGQDLSDTGPGDRPFTDYVTDSSGTATNQDRRGLYLTTAGGLLAGHLSQVHEQWTPGADYRTRFEADPQTGFEKALTGMIILSGFETGGERLQAALDSKSQEDEHSCFSDNTHRDMIQDIQGVQNVWVGSYGSINGVGLRDVVSEVDAALAGAVDDRIAESLSLANALQPPFDQEIAAGSAGNARVEALIVSLRAQEELLFEVFEVFGLAVTIPE